MDNENKIAAYFKGVKAEWGKISWPDRKQVISQTIIVLIIVTAFTIYTFGLDIVFQALIEKFCEFIKYLGLIH